MLLETPTRRRGGSNSSVPNPNAIHAAVLDSDDNSFSVTNIVLNSTGQSFIVDADVLDSDGNAFTIFS